MTIYTHNIHDCSCLYSDIIYILWTPLSVGPGAGALIALTLEPALGLRKHDRMSYGARVCFRIPNQSNGPEVDSTKENYRWIDDDVILPGRFSVDECELHIPSSSRRNSSSSLVYYNDESDSELSDVSFASTLTTNRSHNKPACIKVSSKYLHDHAPSKGCTTNNMSLQQGSRALGALKLL